MGAVLSLGQLSVRIKQSVVSIYARPEILKGRENRHILTVPKPRVENRSSGRQPRQWSELTNLAWTRRSEMQRRGSDDARRALEPLRDRRSVVAGVVVFPVDARKEEKLDVCREPEGNDRGDEGANQSGGGNSSGLRGALSVDTRWEWRPLGRGGLHWDNEGQPFGARPNGDLQLPAHGPDVLLQHL